MIAAFRDARVRPANARPVNPSGDYVLYWCQMARRLHSNHALDHAARWAKKLGKPLVVYEGLKRNYPWASARFHRFMLEGMRDNAAAAAEKGIAYWPFVETPETPGRGLVRKLCASACLLVTDDFPQFIVPAQIRAVAERVDIAVHAVDGNSMVPLKFLGAPVGAAAHLRPRIHKQFAAAWANRADREPHVGKTAKLDPPFPLWKPPENLDAFVQSLGVDATVPAVPDCEGGTAAGRKVLAKFVKSKLHRYGTERNQPDDPEATASSGLSPYLHYGHLSIQEVCEAVLGRDWTTDEINPATRNKDDFFCRDANVNGFLDEAITWRDVGYQWHYGKSAECGSRASESKNRSWQKDGERPAFNFATFDFSPGGETLDRVLPTWAKATLGKHAADRREKLYSLDEFENADTHDDLWNAAQRELVATGQMHNYLRMLWAKKVLEWSETPEAAYRVLEHLNNKYAIDGRDPNSYTGILWCFGLFDRPWAPERPVFGSVRFMSSDNTAKKFPLAGYHEYVRTLPTATEVRTGKTARRPSRLF